MSRATPPLARRSWPALGLLTVAAIGVAGYALAIYAQVWRHGAEASPVDLVSVARLPDVVAVHATSGAIALLTGLVQILLGARFAAHSPWHRRVGLLYVAAVTISGCSGLIATPLAAGGAMGKLGFAALGILWLGVTAYGAWTATRGQRIAHRRAMWRSYALTCAAISLRVQLPAALVAGIPFDSAYPWIAWTCWVPNLLVLEFWIRRR